MEYPTVLGHEQLLSPNDVARLASRTVQRFSKSADQELGVEHVVFPALIADEKSDECDELALILLGHAATIWEDLVSMDGVLKFEHDHYLKLWQMSSPVIPADYILFDEAQDADPVMLAAVNEQDAQLIFCGDRFQAIYEWRGAVNALESVNVDHHAWLTHSFRFGQPIADRANILLSRLDAEKLLKSTDAVASVVGRISRPTCVLCRTNGGVVSAVLRALELRLRPAIVGGAESLIQFAEACRELQAGARTSHPELAPFETWDEVREWVKTDRDEAGNIATMVDLVQDRGVRELTTALRECVDESAADMTISTAHRSKGREWPTVKISSDFAHVDDMDDAELRLAYVAVTRGQLGIDTTSWDAVERKEDRRRPPSPRKDASSHDASARIQRRPPIRAAPALARTPKGVLSRLRRRGRNSSN